MKKKIIIPIIALAFIAMAAVFWMESCKKAVKPIEPSQPPASTLYLKGKVIDFKTKKAIEGAVVEIVGIANVSSDKNGEYSIEAKTVKEKKIEVKATANGYGFASTFAQIEDDIAVVNRLMLLPLNSSIAIGVEGGVLESKNNEGLLGNTIKLEIPPNAFDKTANISSTPFEGINVPGYAPDSMLNLVTVHLESDAGDPNIPLKLSFPLPFSAFILDSLPVLIFNQNEYLWQYSGHYAKINKSTSMAVSEVEIMGTYSLSVAGSINESFFEETDAGSKLLDETKSAYEFSWLAKVEYPEGIPDSLSPNWLKNVASQNIHSASGRVSLFDSTFTTINYIPYKPDSVSILKSTYLFGRWRWIPQVNSKLRCFQNYIYMWIFSDDNNNGVLDPGEVKRKIYYLPFYICFIVTNDESFWRYKHDQGGGK
jgi:hypothetical protein